jgi:DnaK suppressor protein
MTEPNSYDPKLDEDYMGPKMLAHFRTILLDLKTETTGSLNRNRGIIRSERSGSPDLADTADVLMEQRNATEAARRQKLLIGKIDAALARIGDGSYGYCEDTGEEIGVARLLARPVTTLSIEAKQKREAIEGLYASGRPRPAGRVERLSGPK